MSSPDPPHRPVLSRAGVCLVAGVAACFFGIGLWVLSEGHPHEDAYILFRYAEHLARGLGIVFNPAGPRAEGATDFLWLLGLAAGVRAGCDVAVAALGLNALGAALGAALFLRLGGWGGCPDRGSRRAAQVCVGAGLLSLCFYSGALSAYLGFSSACYAAVSGLAFVLLCAPSDRARLTLPGVGLLLGLLRPDGVVLGVGFAALGALRLRRGGRRAYGIALLVSAALGLAYFVGRATYFGLPLPLPLYVKAHLNLPPDSLSALPEALRGLAARFQGVAPSLRWLVSGQGPGPVLVGLAFVALVCRGRDRPTVRRTLVALLPGTLLLAALSISWQSQNVAFRFQAPVQLCLMLALVHLGVTSLSTEQPRWVRAAVPAAVCLALAPSIYFGARFLERRAQPDGREYVEVFAPSLGPELEPDDVVALTEAGRLSYYTSARIEDFAGLNRPRSARTPPRVEELRALSPTVLFYHHGGTLDLGRVAAARGARGVIALDPEALRDALRPGYRDLFEQAPARYADSGGRAHLIAPVVLTRYLTESPAYHVVAVDYRGSGRFDHVWGFRSDRFASDVVESGLRSAWALEGYRGYLELARELGRARRDRFAARWLASLRSGDDLVSRYASGRDVRRMRALASRLVSSYATEARRHTPLGPFELVLRFGNGERGALFLTERARQVVGAELVLYPVGERGR